MIYNEDKLKAFEDLISHRAQEEKDKILKEIRDQREAECEKAKDSALEAVYNLMQSELVDMETETTAELSRKLVELRKQLFLQRDAYVKNVFNSAKEKLSAFSQTKDYPTYLSSRLKALGKECGFTSVVIRVRPQDMKMEPELKAALGLPCRVEEDASIQLGGVILKDAVHGMEIDATLEDALEQQRDWFHSHSGLTVQTQLS